MKKIIKFLVFIIALVIAIPSTLGFSGAVASANTVTTVVSKSAFSSTASSIISEYSAIKNRLAGSDGEKQASVYIKNYLDNLKTTKTNLVAKNNAYIKDGEQKFTFNSKFSSIVESSQNIIYTLNSNKETDKKVIIGCHYDSMAIDMDMTSEAYGKQIESESINGSAASVATLLAIATYLPVENLDFDVEFVFFGAGESNHAGSNYYTSGISKEDKKNIVCMINISQVALGTDLYFYMNEIETKSSKFVEDVIYNNRVNVKKIDVSNLNKMLIAEQNELGLDYNHVALDSDNINFMKEGIETINIFAGDYSKGVIIGRQEFAGQDLLTYTANDSLEYIATNLPDYSVENKLYEVFNAVYSTITDNNFVSVFESSKGSTNWFYKVFTNNTLVLYLTVVVFIVFVIVAMYIYYKLTIKAYYANVEMEFLSSVVKITEQLDKNGKDDNVAKVVSQVIANDIKKDKVIKVKPSKKDKDDK